MTLWHPLKLAGVFYIVADTSLLLGGLGYDNWLLAVSGICGLLGNASLLFGGSGAKQIESSLLQQVAPYAERLSLSFYMMQNMTFALSCVIMYDTTIWSGVFGAGIGVLGSITGIFIKTNLFFLQPYQMTGLLWLLASAIGIKAGVSTANLGVIIANIALVLGAICVMVSHRAEFQNTNLKA